MNDTPVVASVAASTPCANASAALTATVSDGASTPMTYTWIVGSSSSMTNVNTITTQALNSNTAFTVTVTNAGGCTSAQKTGTITITSKGANGQPATCGCLSGTTDCSGTCRTTGNYTLNNGACTGDCAKAYVQLYDQCGNLINAKASTYDNSGCNSGCEKCEWETYARNYDMPYSSYDLPACKAWCAVQPIPTNYCLGTVDMTTGGYSSVSCVCQCHRCWIQ